MISTRSILAPKSHSSTRRRFLKETYFGAAFLAAFRFLPEAARLSSIPTEIPKDLRFFDDHEYLIFAAIAARIVGQPDSGRATAPEIDVALRADRFLSVEHPEIQEQFHQLLAVFNSPVAAFLFDFRFSGFLDMTDSQQDSYLEDWMTSVLSFRRTAFQALKRTCLSMHYTDERSWDEIGFEGMFLPEDRR